jgi:hypothetical protein
MKINIKDLPTAYINLAEDVDKKESIEKHLSTFKNVKRIEAVKGNKETLRYAIADSHKLALDSFDKPPFLILEDDCFLLRDVEEIGIPNDADIVLLGIWDEKILKSLAGIKFHDNLVYEDVSGAIAKATTMNGMHAVIYVSERSIELATRVFELSPKTGRHIDNLFRHLTPFINVYALKNPMFAQSSKIKETSVIIKG